MMQRMVLAMLWPVLFGACLLPAYTRAARAKIVDKFTAVYEGPIGWPFECPLKTRLIWQRPLVAEQSGSRQMPQGPLLGQGDLGMTVLSDEGQYPSGPASGAMALMLGANQMWALSDNDWSQCHYDEAHCAAVGLNYTSGACWLGWVPGCSHQFPRQVGLGGLNLTAPAFAGPGSSFRAEQLMREGAISAGYVREADGASLSTRSVMLDETKAMLTEISFVAPSNATPVKITLDLWSYTMSVNTSLADATVNDTVRVGVQEGMSWFIRKSLPDSWNATAQILAAVGMVAMTNSSAVQIDPPIAVSPTTVRQQLTLPPGQSACVVTAVHTSVDAATANTAGGARPPPPWKQHVPLPLTLRYLHSVIDRGADATTKAIRTSNQKWWDNYWAQSSISLPTEPLIEYYWHSAQYTLGCASRPGKVAPGLYGPWVTNDLPAWHGDYTMDYNQEATFYAAHSSNHADQAQPEIDLMMDYRVEAAKGSRSLMSQYGKTCIDNDPGLTFPSHLAPFGLPAAIGPSPNGDQRIRWNGELSMTVLLWDWEYTHNTTRLRQYTWPLLTGFAKKWRCWLARVPSVGAPDGYLLVNYHDSWGEQNGASLPELINPTQPQAWLIRLFEFLPQMASILNEPVEQWWGEILEHLPPITTGAPDAIGGGTYWEQASNSLHPDDSLYALFPAETADVLGRPGRLIKEGSSDRYVFDTTDASAHADRGQVLAANTTITRSVVAVGNNTNNRTVFWSPTGRTAPKFDVID